MAASLPLSSPHHLSLSLNTKLPFSSRPHCLSSFLALPLSAKASLLSHTGPHRFSPKTKRRWTVSAIAEDALPSDVSTTTTATTTAIDTTQQIVSSGDDGVSTVISVLLFIAFIGLSVLTIGIIYIGVTDFLQKREREKFEKEEAAKKKKGGKKVKVRAKAGPRGFGQKIDEDEDEDNY